MRLVYLLLFALVCSAVAEGVNYSATMHTVKTQDNIKYVKDIEDALSMCGMEENTTVVRYVECGEMLHLNTTVFVGCREVFIEGRATCAVRPLVILEDVTFSSSYVIFADVDIRVVSGVTLHASGVMYADVNMTIGWDGVFRMVDEIAALGFVGSTVRTNGGFIDASAGALMMHNTDLSTHSGMSILLSNLSGVALLNTTVSAARVRVSATYAMFALSVISTKDKGTGTIDISISKLMGGYKVTFIQGPDGHLNMRVSNTSGFVYSRVDGGQMAFEVVSSDSAVHSVQFGFSDGIVHTSMSRMSGAPLFDGCVINVTRLNISGSGASPVDFKNTILAVDTGPINVTNIPLMIFNESVIGVRPSADVVLLISNMDPMAYTYLWLKNTQLHVNTSAPLVMTMMAIVVLDGTNPNTGIFRSRAGSFVLSNVTLDGSSKVADLARHPPLTVRVKSASHVDSNHYSPDAA